MACVRIDVAAQPVRLVGNVTCSSSPGAFENRVLDEMRDTIKFGRLVTRPMSQPDAGGDGPQTRHVFRQHGQAIRKFG